MNNFTTFHFPNCHVSALSVRLPEQRRYSLATPVLRWSLPPHSLQAHAASHTPAPRLSGSRARRALGLSDLHATSLPGLQGAISISSPHPSCKIMLLTLHARIRRGPPLAGIIFFLTLNNTLPLSSTLIALKNCTSYRPKATEFLPSLQGAFLDGRF